MFSLDAARLLLASRCKQAVCDCVGAALLGLNKMLLNVVAQLGEDDTGKYAGHTHHLPAAGEVCVQCTGSHLLLRLDGKHSLKRNRRVNVCH